MFLQVKYIPITLDLKLMLGPKHQKHPPTPWLRHENVTLFGAIKLLKFIRGGPVEDNGATGHIHSHSEGLRGAQHSNQSLLRSGATKEQT